MKVNIESRSGKQLVPGGLEISTEASVADLQKLFYKAKPKYYPSRQRYTLPLQPGQKKPTALEPSKKLSEYNLSAGAVLIFKDLGPQVGYRAVFFWEYFGPLVLYALIYAFPHIVYPGYSKYPEKSIVQKLALAHWTFHYTKRILETFFVHRFSHATMPIFNLYRNCGYYWLFGAYVAYFVNHPLYTAPPLARSLTCFAIAAVCQASNFWCHVILANLRPPGEKGYVIPRGFLFNYITTPNYTTEIAGWVCFTVATSSLPAALFGAAGTYQMAMWAIAKHKRLLKTFDGKEGREKYPRRWIMLPPIF